MVPQIKTAAQKISTAEEPIVFNKIIPGIEITNPAKVPSNVSCAFHPARPCCGRPSGVDSVRYASASSCEEYSSPISSSAVAISGTSAPRVTMYNFESTRIKKASGKRAKL